MYIKKCLKEDKLSRQQKRILNDEDILKRNLKNSIQR